MESQNKKVRTQKKPKNNGSPKTKEISSGRTDSENLRLRH